MERPAAGALLDTWEAARSQRPYARSLTLLALAEAGDDLAAWSLGKRDSHLLTLRERLFGPRLAGVTSCPACGSRLEVTLDVADIRAPFADDVVSALQVETADGVFALRLRPVRVADLSAVAERPLAQRLLDLCLVEACCNGLPCASLPAEVQAAAAAHLAELDPQSDVQLALACAECGGRWTAPFDIGAYLWQEIDRWAQRTLAEVHMLARAYGWSEAEILALSPQRRQAYLERVMA